MDTLFLEFGCVRVLEKLDCSAHEIQVSDWFVVMKSVMGKGSLHFCRGISLEFWGHIQFINIKNMFYNWRLCFGHGEHWIWIHIT